MYEKEYLFRIEKDGTSYDFTIIFKEMFYEYEYGGNKYCNGAKINVKASSIADMGCVDWGLKQFSREHVITYITIRTTCQN